MPSLFGTDGIRGVAGRDLTHDLAVRVGRAAAAVFAASGGAPLFVTVRDTRASGEEIEAALAAGLSAGGAEVRSAGVLPTPAAAFLTVELGASAGAVISASHNPAEYNGIKFFGPDGYKATSAQESAIEEAAAAPAANAHQAPGPNPAPDPTATPRYVAHALAALEGRSLAGLKVVVDCANGAASVTSPQALADAGAGVVAIHNTPDGTNINLACGSTSPQALVAEVRARGADVGLAHDGDADRVIAVDERGEIVDGDAMIAALALELKRSGRLAGDMVVTTVMANLGFRRAMASAGISLVETPVGDRYVLEAMRARGAVLGGEQSGHVIFSDYATTGDGLVTGLRLLGLMVSSGKRLSELAGVVEKFPQVLLNVNVAANGNLRDAERVWKTVAGVEGRLGDGGRVLVRASGTEPLVRVMVEASEDAAALSAAEEIAAVVREELGAGHD